MKHLLAIFVLALLCQPVSGQDKPIPPPRDFKPEAKDTRDVLPALTLPEYVITGSDMISFTEDRKNGAGIPDSRDFTSRAGLGTREQRFFNTSPTRMPLRKPALTGSEEIFRLRAGLGTYSTPAVEAWYADRYQLGDAASHMAYERSNGHAPHADYSRFNFDIAGGTYLPRDILPLFASSRIQGDLQIEAQDYGLYADKLVQRNPSLDFRRNAFGIAMGADLISRRNSVLDHDLRISFSHFAIDEALAVRDTLPLDEYQQVENRIGIDGAVTTPIAEQMIRFGLQLHVNDLSESAVQPTRPFFISTDGKTVFALGERMRLHTGAAIFLYRGSDHASQFRVYPSMLLRYAASDDWSLYAGWLPEVREQSLRGFLRQNPYLMLASSVRHTDLPWRFEAGTEFDNRGESSGRIFIEYLSTLSWPRFSLLPDPVQQQWEMRYNGRAEIFNIHAELSQAFSTRTRIQFETVFRTSSLGEAQGRVPYLPDYEARVLLQHDFPFDLRVQTTFQLVGEQEADGSVLPAWMLLGLDLEYRVIRNFGVFLRFENLLDQSWQRWPGYRERPFFMMGGVTAHF
ncbi:MAG: TonB-dependent receptor [Bacteroidota bacterium]|jgi:hypothetical protein